MPRDASEFPFGTRSADISRTYVVNVSRSLRQLAALLTTELPEMQVVVGGLGTGPIAVVALSDQFVVEATGRQQWRPDVIVIDVDGDATAQVAAAVLNAGAAGFIAGTSSDLIAAFIRSIARRRRAP